MKYNKKIALYSLFIITAQLNNYTYTSGWWPKKSWFENAGVNAAKVGADKLAAGMAEAAPTIGIEAGKVVSSGLTQASTTLGADLLKAGGGLKDGLTQASTTLGADLLKTGDGLKDGLAQASTTLGNNVMTAGGDVKDGLTKVGIESVEKLAPVVKVAVGIYAGVQLWSVGKDVVSGAQAVHAHFRPSAAQQAADMEAYRRLAYYKSAQSYYTCMASSKATPRTSLGFPARCHSFEEAFVVAGGRKEVDERKETFKEYDKDEPSC